MDNIYIDYSNYIKIICDNDDLSNFKFNDKYRSILEHITQNLGYEYFKLLYNDKKISNKEILKFSLLNDKIGNPVKDEYFFGKFSSSNFRYIYHTYLILSYLNKLNINKVKIVEIGGGYGGLCLCLNYFKDFFNINIEKYYLIDLEQPIRLQKKYLDMHNIKNIEVIDSSTFGENIKDSNLFLISNYSFSEINDELQKKYIEILFPKVKHGFMCWNSIKTYNFGFDFIEEDEKPSSYDDNKYIYF
jgi:hypothetical protein